MRLYVLYYCIVKNFVSKNFLFFNFKLNNYFFKIKKNIIIENLDISEFGFGCLHLYKC